MAEDVSAGPSERNNCDSLVATHVPASTRSNKKQVHSKLRKRRIKLLEKKLELYHRQIQRVSEMEVTLDDMETRSSAYLKEDWLKRRFLQVWEELCDLVGVSPEVQMNDHVYPRPYQGTQFPEINRRVERLLQLGEFPDYYDVCQLVNRCNEKHSLEMKHEEVLHLSKRLFKEVGDILKKQRMKDFMHHVGCHFTDDAPEDPALLDSDLLQRLTENHQLSQQKLEEVCEKFVDKQEREGDDTASSSDNQLEEEEEEEEQEEYSPTPDIQHEISRIEESAGLADPSHQQSPNGTDDEDEVEDKHEDGKWQALHCSPSVLDPDMSKPECSEEGHTSRQDATLDKCHGSEQELTPDVETSPDSVSPPVKRIRLEAQARTLKPCLSVVRSKNGSSSKRQELVVISSEEDDTTKDIIVLDSDD